VIPDIDVMALLGTLLTTQTGYLMLHRIYHNQDSKKVTNGIFALNATGTKKGYAPVRMKLTISHTITKTVRII
jgi:predicted MarR family transcription regulator